MHERADISECELNQPKTRVFGVDHFVWSGNEPKAGLSKFRRKLKNPVIFFFGADLKKIKEKVTPIEAKPSNGPPKTKTGIST